MLWLTLAGELVQNHPTGLFAYCSVTWRVEGSSRRGALGDHGVDELRAIALTWVSTATTDSAA
jgi:hypothetical protein